MLRPHLLHRIKLDPPIFSKNQNKYEISCKQIKVCDTKVYSQSQKITTVPRLFQSFFKTFHSLHSLLLGPFSSFLYFLPKCYKVLSNNHTSEVHFSDNILCNHTWDLSRRSLRSVLLLSATTNLILYKQEKNQFNYMPEVEKNTERVNSTLRT